jgi:iron complex transport system substrate-binding protein
MTTHRALVLKLALLSCAWLGSARPSLARDDRAMVSVTIVVDFGRAGRAPLRKVVEIESGSDAVEATRAALPVEQDVLCCSSDDVWSIGDVGPDVRNHAYWFWRLNGGAAPAMPAEYFVAAGDTIEWSYGGKKPMRNAKHRVVSLLPAATDIVFAIGAEDDLVAISHLCAMPTTRKVPRVVTTTIDSDSLSMREIDAAVREASASKVSPYGLDETAISALEPTLVLSQGVCPVCAVPDDQAQRLTEPGARACAELLTLTPRTLADVAADIRRVGEALDLKNGAAVVARDFERRIENVREKAASRETARPSVVVLEWFDPLWVSGEWSVEMVDAAGGRPLLVTAAEPSRRVDWSDLERADPDFIVLAACSMDIERATRELPALVGHAGWRSLRAVRENRVYLLDGEHHFSSPGPGLARGVEVLGEIITRPDAPRAVSESECRRIDSTR